MGTWSAGPFGSDAAADWCYLLESQSIRAVVENTITELDRDDSDKCEELVAAGAVVLAASFEPVKGVKKEIKDLIVEQGYFPEMEVVNALTGKLQVVAENSELAELWNGEGHNTWLKNINKIIEGLKAVKQETLPERTPEKRAFPRSLHKMVDYPNIKNIPEYRDRLVKKLKKIKEFNSEINYRMTPLNLLILKGFFDEAKMIVEMGADVNFSDYGRPLPIACRVNSYDMVTFLVSHGAQVVEDLSLLNIKTGERSVLSYSVPLLLAIRNFETPEIVEFLVENGADLSQICTADHTLMYHAAWENNSQAVEYLVSKGMDVDFIPEGGDEAPLTRALLSHSFDSAKTLIKYGANVSVVDSFAAIVMDGLKQEKGFLECMEIAGRQDKYLL